MESPKLSYDRHDQIIHWLKAIHEELQIINGSGVVQFQRSIPVSLFEFEENEQAEIEVLSAARHPGGCLVRWDFVNVPHQPFYQYQIRLSVDEMESYSLDQFELNELDSNFNEFFTVDESLNTSQDVWVQIRVAQGIIEGPWSPVCKVG